MQTKFMPSQTVGDTRKFVRSHLSLPSYLFTLLYDQVELPEEDDEKTLSVIIVRQLEHAKEDIKEIVDILAIVDPDEKKQAAINFVTTRHLDGTKKNGDEAAVVITVVQNMKRRLEVLARPGP